jgi:hypothetical protein
MITNFKQVSIDELIPGHISVRTPVAHSYSVGLQLVKTYAGTSTNLHTEALPLLRYRALIPVVESPLH